MGIFAIAKILIAKIHWLQNDSLQKVLLQIYYTVKSDAGNPALVLFPLLGSFLSTFFILIFWHDHFQASIGQLANILEYFPRSLYYTI